MSTKKLTDWYSGNQKPVRVGIYQRRYATNIFYCWWNGTNFSMGVMTHSGCATLKMADGPSIVQTLQWRGLANEPK